MTAGARTILHADMDAFYAAIEQRDRPELRGKPVIVGGSGPRSVVATASYEARTFGVRSAMPGTVARRLCPQGIFVRPRMDVYAAVSAKVREVFESVTDAVEPLSLDEAFLDVTGSASLFGDGAAIARRIKEQVRACTGLTVSVGVAACKFVAKVASDLRKPDGLVVVPAGTEREFLAPLPVSRLWGAGEKTVACLERAGLRTIAHVQACTLGQLAAILGAEMGRHFHDLAHGIDDRPVETGREARSLGHEMTFVKDLATRAEASEVLLQLSEQVGRRLRQEGLDADTIRIKVRHPDFTTYTRQQRVARTQDDALIHRTAMALLDASWPGRPGLRLVGVTAAGLAPATAVRQGQLFQPAPARTAKLLRALDAIRDRFGDDAIHRGGQRRSTTPWGPGDDPGRA